MAKKYYIETYGEVSYRDIDGAKTSAEQWSRLPSSYTSKKAAVKAAKELEDDGARVRVIQAESHPFFG